MILIALGLLIVGFFVAGKQGVTMIMSGLALGVLGGTELSIREHFAGYKSHSTLLAAVVGVIVASIAFLALPTGWRAIPFAIGVVAFGTGFYLFRQTFKRRSGGLGFRR